MPVVRRKMLPDIMNRYAWAEMSHPCGILRGYKPIRYTTSANKTWRVTFEFDSGDAYAVDLEDYR